jgi:hypothetical protein
MVVDTCNPSPWEIEAGGSQVWGQPYIKWYIVFAYNLCTFFYIF